MKKIVFIIMTFILMITVILCYVDAQEENVDLKWKATVDQNGNIVYILDMSEEEIEKYEIAQLKKVNEGIFNRTSGYTYEYEKKGDIFDSGDSETSKILIGKYLMWAQRTKASVSKEVRFSLKGSYKKITGDASLKISTSEEYSFDNSYDNCLGLFGKIHTSEYQIIKKDKYSGNVISKTTQNVMTCLEKSIRCIYNKSSNKISYKYGGSWYVAKMIKSGMSSPITKSSELEIAKTSVFD